MSCPICHKPTQTRFRPFCSQRCADVDLGRWFKGAYRTPSFRQDNDPADLTEAEVAAIRLAQEPSPQ
ncbi:MULTISPECIES: DNA gyrase inhibitor YacG [Bombella]|uniref:DNA gyrase inhibitor YacG n=1 Tax=Bombella pollinis TaxID=2967337 RepID=A0ABT3WK91_9PROT|nr:MULTISPECIES: DNA gyrase inhibitor YacG [Bombella]MCX5619098.1 DNA gyrase inhibitor YacG [Bombella pollinis]MUG05459.1 DNA gyrase inhibitor YacG [Bombella sp. ESL0378]MUG89380.1 DNA gyrase inhibitor YacG [Bombella sp. ESL0385]